MSPVWHSWSTPLAPLIGAAVALALYGHAFLRLRRRGRADHASWGRAALYGLGVGLSLLVLVSPLDAVGEEYLISAHMLQHVVLADLAPLLILLGLRGPLLFFFLPAPVLRRLAPVRRLRATLHWLLGPWVAWTVWVVAMVAWHIPRAYDYALSHRTAHDLEHLSFVVAGLLIWHTLLDPARTGRLTAPGRILFAVAVFIGPHPIVEVLFFRNTVSYPAYAAQPDRLFGLSAVT
ncbi:MAG: cytochrome c oxidase assembly protein, partial [Gaiellaceae bacterium]